jgi:uncharacterized protein
MPERSSYAPGVPSWIDLATTDPAAAREFYGQLFGWEFDISPDEHLGHYTTVTKNGKTVAGMVGTPMTEQPPAWATYFATEDAQKLADRITDNGGAIVMGPDPVGQLGSLLVWQDPTGAFVGAWQAGTHSGAQLVNEPGAFSWNELNTRDLDAAAAFYPAILPVTAHDESEGEFRYQTLQVDGHNIAGMWQMSHDVPSQVHPHWAVYFSVADTDAAVDQATALGASVTVPAKDSPYGRFAGLTDPQGAMFYVVQPAVEQG